LPQLMTIDEGTQAVPGSHRALPGTHGGGLGGRRSAPAADGRLRRMSRREKGVKKFLKKHRLTYSQAVLGDETRK